MLIWSVENLKKLHKPKFDTFKRLQSAFWCFLLQILSIFLLNFNFVNQKNN